MEDLIKQILTDHFIEYKKFHVFILIVFIAVIGLFQVAQSIWVSKKIEKFKALMKKSEIQFSRYHNLQVDALKLIYTKLVVFHRENTVLFNSKYKNNDHRQFKKRIGNWIIAYIDCINSFSAEKLLLPKNLKELASRTITEFEQVKDIIISEREELNYLELENDSDWNSMYDYEERELEIINDKISKLKSNTYIEKAESNIRELRISIEYYFEAMNK